jgi:hypothetical protein
MNALALPVDGTVAPIRIPVSRIWECLAGFSCPIALPKEKNYTAFRSIVKFPVFQRQEWLHVKMLLLDFCSDISRFAAH